MVCLMSGLIDEFCRNGHTLPAGLRGFSVTRLWDLVARTHSWLIVAPGGQSAIWVEQWHDKAGTSQSVLSLRLLKSATQGWGAILVQPELAFAKISYFFFFFNQMKLTKFALQMIPCWNCRFKGTCSAESWKWFWKWNNMEAKQLFLCCNSCRGSFSLACRQHSRLWRINTVIVYLLSLHLCHQCRLEMCDYVVTIILISVYMAKTAHLYLKHRFYLSWVKSRWPIVDF